MTLDADTKFEVALLESARGDAQPRDVGNAWARFAGALGLAATEVGGAASADHDAAGPAPIAGGVPAATVAGSRALRWVLLGALGGSGLTAAVMSARRAPPPGAPATDVAATSRPTQPPLPPPALVAPAGPGVETAPASELTARRRASSVRQPEPEAPSALAAEVSRLDTARVASAMGDYDSAMRLVESYHASFPSGVLAADADVVALEAAAAKHDRAEVVRRAALFLALHPNDPHAARVRWIADHVSGP